MTCHPPSSLTLEGSLFVKKKKIYIPTRNPVEDECNASNGGGGGMKVLHVSYLCLHHVNVSAGQQPIHPNKTRPFYFYHPERGSSEMAPCIFFLHSPVPSPLFVHKRFVDSLIAIVMVILSWKHRKRCRMSSRMACPDCLYPLSNTAPSSSPLSLHPTDLQPDRWQLYGKSRDEPTL